MAQNRRRSSGSGLTAKQKQAAMVLGICALVLIITIAVVAVIVSKAGKKDPTSGSGSTAVSGGGTGTSNIDSNFDPSKYGSAILGETDDAGKEYIEQTIFVGDSNTFRYYQNGLLDLDHVVAVEGLGIQQLASDKSIYFKSDDTGYSIPEALAKMKPRRVIMMIGTNNADGNMTASEFASNYKSAVDAIQSAYSYTDIIVAAVPPIPEDHSQYPNVSMDTINGFNEALAQMCADNNLKFLNISELLVGDNGYGKAQYFQAGDVHLKKDALTGIIDYARKHAYLGTEDRRPDTSNIPTRRKQPTSGTSTNNTTTPTPDDNKTYTAQYNVDKNVGGTLESGDQKGVTSLTFKDKTSSDSITVKAVPASGYTFVKWSDGKTDATRTDKDFKQNLNVTAMFATELKMTIQEGSSGTITQGDTQYLHIKLSDSGVSTDGVIWTLNGTEFKRGLSCGVSPEKEGTYTVKATLTTGGKTYTAEYKLTVKPKATAAPTPVPTPPPVDSVSVEGGTTLDYTGGVVTLTAKATPNNSQPSFKWDATGGVIEGSGAAVKFAAPANNTTSDVTYTITVTANGKSATATVVVRGAPAPTEAPTPVPTETPLPSTEPANSETAG